MGDSDALNALTTKPHSPNFLDKATAEKLSESADLRTCLTHPIPGVWSGRLFDPSYCQRLIERCISATLLYQDLAPLLSIKGLPIDKVLTASESFMGPLTDILNRCFVEKLHPSMHLELQTAYVICYTEKGDREHPAHQDASDLTLNVCLGQQFTGGRLKFAANPAAMVQVRGEPDSKLDMKFMPELAFHTVDHEVGRCHIHSGAHIHGATVLESGSRYNLICWFKIVYDPFPFMQLPSELQREVMAQMDLQEVGRLAQCSKEMCTASLDDDVWLIRCHRNFPDMLPLGRLRDNVQAHVQLQRRCTSGPPLCGLVQPLCGAPQRVAGPMMRPSPYSYPGYPTPPGQYSGYAPTRVARGPPYGGWGMDPFASPAQIFESERAPLVVLKDHRLPNHYLFPDLPPPTAENCAVIRDVYALEYSKRFPPDAFQGPSPPMFWPYPVMTFPLPPSPLDPSDPFTAAMPPAYPYPAPPMTGWSAPPVTFPLPPTLFRPPIVPPPMRSGPRLMDMMLPYGPLNPQPSGAPMMPMQPPLAPFVMPPGGPRYDLLEDDPAPVAGSAQ